MVSHDGALIWHIICFKQFSGLNRHKSMGCYSSSEIHFENVNLKTELESSTHTSTFLCRMLTMGNKIAIS